MIYPYFRLIGDVHGHASRYVMTASESQYSLQVGDMGFTYSHMMSLDDQYHRFLPGNHDNYYKLQDSQVAHALMGFGEWDVPEFGPIWYLRGAWSIDLFWRTKDIDWWEEEELVENELDKAKADYLERKPRFVVTHECPSLISPWVLSRGAQVLASRTARCLSECWSQHKPEWWVFGHYHLNRQFECEGTRFQCLNELSCLDFDEKGELLQAPEDQSPGPPFRITPEVLRTLT